MKRTAFQWLLWPTVDSGEREVQNIAVLAVRTIKLIFFFKNRFADEKR